MNLKGFNQIFFFFFFLFVICSIYVSAEVPIIKIGVPNVSRINSNSSDCWDNDCLFLDAFNREILANRTGGNVLFRYNITSDFFKGSMDWNNLTSYPVACPNGTHISQLGDLVTCTTTSALNLTDFDERLNTNRTEGDVTFGGKVGIGITPTKTLDINGHTWVRQPYSLGTSVVAGTDWAWKFYTQSDNSVTAYSRWNNMNFMNRINAYDFIWKIETGGVELMRLTGAGNLDVTGNITGNQFYAEMWNYSSNASAWTFSLPTLGIYYNLTGLFADKLNGFDITYESQANGGTYLTTKVAGKYKLDGAFSFEGVNNNQLYAISTAKNFKQSLSRNCYSRRYISTQAIVASSTITCILDLAVGDTINVQFENENSNKDVKIHQVNINLWRVGT